jgi:thioredoxin 1
MAANSVEEYKKGIVKEKFEEIIENNKYVVIDVFTVWCGPCKTMSPIFHELAEKFEQIKFLSVDLDETRWLGSHGVWGTHAIPTFLFFKDNKMVKKQIGGMPKEGFIKLIEKELLKD